MNQVVGRSQGKPLYLIRSKSRALTLKSTTSVWRPTNLKLRARLLAVAAEVLRESRNERLTRHLHTITSER